MLTEFIKIDKLAGRFLLQKVYINAKHIVFMVEDSSYKQDLMEGRIELGLNKEAEFTKIRMIDNSSFSELTVVGSPESIQSKLFSSRKTLLRG